MLECESTPVEFRFFIRIWNHCAIVIAHEKAESVVATKRPGVAADAPFVVAGAIEFHSEFDQEGLAQQEFFLLEPKRDSQIGGLAGWRIDGTLVGLACLRFYSLKQRLHDRVSDGRFRGIGIIRRCRRHNPAGMAVIGVEINPFALIVVLPSAQRCRDQ